MSMTVLFAARPATRADLVPIIGLVMRMTPSARLNTLRFFAMLLWRKTAEFIPDGVVAIKRYSTRPKTCQVLAIEQQDQLVGLVAFAQCGASAKHLMPEISPDDPELMVCALAPCDDPSLKDMLFRLSIAGIQDAYSNDPPIVVKVPIYSPDYTQIVERHGFVFRRATRTAHIYTL
jgi:hypothetical protein